MAAPIHEIVRGSIANRKRLAKRTARNARVGSSTADRAWSIRTMPRARSFRPPNGSSTRVRASGAIWRARALIVKSRRARSSSIGAGETLGSAAGAS
jgi:hypothetical protein